MATVSLPAVEARELEALSDLEAGLTIREAVPLLIRLTSGPTYERSDLSGGARHVPPGGGERS